MQLLFYSRENRRMPEISTSTPKLPRVKGAALHRQLFLLLRAQILDGSFPPGSALPTEDRLCETYGVSRITVRRTLSDLEAEKLVERRQGRGTFVKTDAPPARPAATLNLIGSLRQTADSTKTKVLLFEHVVPPPAIASLLNLGDQALAYHVIRLRSSRTAPAMLTDAWVPDNLGVDLTPAALQKSPLYVLLMRHGIRFDRVVQEITAVAAETMPAEHLQVEIGMPLLKVTRLLYDPAARPIQYLNALVVPERSRLLMDITGDDINTLSAGYITHG
jgi:GntR family transcriptional regulator